MIVAFLIWLQITGRINLQPLFLLNLLLLFLFRVFNFFWLNNLLFVASNFLFVPLIFYLFTLCSVDYWIIWTVFTFFVGISHTVIIILIVTKEIAPIHFLRVRLRFILIIRWCHLSLWFFSFGLPLFCFIRLLFIQFLFLLLNLLHIL